MKPHPHIEVITAYFNGEQIQFRRKPEEPWLTLGIRVHGEMLSAHHPAFLPEHEYRVKPKLAYTLALTVDQFELLWDCVGCARLLSAGAKNPAEEHLHRRAQEAGRILNTAKTRPEQ